MLESQLAGRGCDLVLCPELFATGYDRMAHYEDLAEAPDGPFGRKMAELARAHGVALAYGYAERDADGLYNSAALLGPDGVLLANHRKRLPSPHSFEERSFATGDAVTFADLGDIRLAIIICYEVEFPESVRQAARGGAQLVLVPTALGREWGVVAEKMVATRAFENGVWLAYADHAGAQGDLRFFGGSRIVSPLGQETCCTVGEEDFAVASIDTRSVQRAQERLPYLRDSERL